ncbi:MAG: hypothetical protein JSR23_02665 [Proteobacteria bacterium]|nr:hypothetical protein [Pseudomonadota bacterium]
MPHSTKQRQLLPSFDAGSVMLFAALTVGGALAQAQPAPSTSALPRYQLDPGRSLPEPNTAAGGGARLEAAKRTAGVRS